MSAQPLTYEGVLELFTKSDARFDKRMEESDKRFEKRMEELVKRMKETDKRMKRTDERIGFVDARIGDLVEGMIGSDNIVNQFRDLGYNVSRNVRNETFGTKETKTDGEIDLLLEDGDVAILIEIKTKLSFGKILKHVQRLAKYRRWQDMQGGVKKRYIGAIACAIMKDEDVQFAHDNGMYVIAQLGNKVKIVPPPEGFKAKEW